MKLGVSAFAWTGSFQEDHLHLLSKVRAYGFDGFEIPMFAPSALPVRALHKAFAASDLECTICAILPAGINPISPDADTRKRSRAHLVQCIESAADLGAHLLGGPLYAPIGYLPDHRPTLDEWRWAVEIFQSLGELLDTYSITLSLEPVNRSETFFLRTGVEAKRFCEAVGHARIGVTIDSFHANIEEKQLASSLQQLGSSLKHFHASENDRGLLGTGHVNFGSCIEALKQMNYDGYLMIEGFGYAPDEKAPGTLWAEMQVSPEAIATEGLSYLRGLLGS